MSDMIDYQAANRDLDFALIEQADGLLSEDRENPEYDRGVVEAVCRTLGLADSDKETVLVNVRAGGTLAGILHRGITSKGVDDEQKRLLASPHFVAQVTRMHEAHRLIQGTRDARALDEVLNDVAQAIAILVLNPHMSGTANHGGISVERRPYGGGDGRDVNYDIHLWGSTVHGFQLWAEAEHAKK